MKKRVGSTIALLFLCTLVTAGCNKQTPSPGDKVRVALASVQPQPGQPLATTAATLGDRWNDQSGVPWAAARSLAQACKLSYATEAEINASLSQWGFAKVSHFQSGSLYACIASDDRTVLIAFRGTDDPKDWLVNTDAIPQSVPQGIIHGGFYQGMRTLYSQMVTAATDHGLEKKHLWVTGHSLGGALAVAFAYEGLAEGRFKPAAVVTFGQPLLADDSLGAYVSGQLGGNYVRFVNERDVVTRVPPGYAHFGKLIWFHEGKLETSGSHPELAPLSAAEFASFQQGIRDLRQLGKSFDPARLQSFGAQVAAITDHFMDAYLRSIDALAKSPPQVAAR